MLYIDELMFRTWKETFDQIKYHKIEYNLSLGYCSLNIHVFTFVLFK